MSRLLLFAVFSAIVINTSCERCKRCTYSYTETVIVETLDGEVEETVEYTGVALTKDGESYTTECLKWKEYRDDKNAFTIEGFYETAEESSLDNYEVTCQDL